MPLDPFWPPSVPFTFNSDTVLGSEAKPLWSTTPTSQEIVFLVETRPVLLTWSPR